MNAAGTPRRLGLHALLAGVLVLTVLAGGALRPEGGSLAMVWPAAAAATAWVAASWGSVRRVAGVTVLTLLVTGGMQVPDGIPVTLAAVMGLANALEALVAAAVLAAAQRRLGSVPWTLRRPGDLLALVVAAVVGSAVGAAVAGVTTVTLVPGSPWTTGGTWLLRHASAIFVLGAVALRLVDDRGRPWQGLARRVLWRRSAEVAVAALGASAACLVVFGTSQHLPLSFLLVPISVALALRLDTTAVALHVPLVGVLVVALTLDGRGPFALDDLAVRPVLAQAFVSVVGLVSLVLALHRDERRVLLAGMHAAQREVAEQAELLRAVFEATGDALSVYDRTGRMILRNGAAGRLFAGVSADLTDVEQHERLSLEHVDGRPLTIAELPVQRAIRGERVVDEDYVIRPPGLPSRTVSTTVHPVAASERSPWAGAVVSAARDVTAERQAWADTAAARDLYAGILEAATEQAILRCDPDGTITVFNPGAERMTGWPAADVIGRSLRDLHDPDELAAVAATRGLSPESVLWHDALSGWPVTLRWTWLRADGSPLQALLTVSATWDATGRPDGLIALGVDVTEQVVVESQLADSEQRFRAAFDTAPVAMMIVGLTGPSTGRILEVNTTLTRFTGLPDSALLDRDVRALAPPADHATAQDVLAPLLEGLLDVTEAELPFQHADGSVRWGQLSATRIAPDPDGGGVVGAPTEPYLLCLVEDVTARRQAEAELVRLALHDALTGLPNRTLLHERLAAALEADPHGSGVGVLFCDLDGFKEVNDAAGHAAGDELLRHVARRFEHAVRPTDTLARLGGDEFAVVCSDLSGAAELGQRARRLLTALETPVALLGGTFSVGVSIGGAVRTVEGGADTLLDAADTAMYVAKRAGKNRFALHMGGGRAAVLPHPRVPA
ncbi:diguanylate cyclase domain-containing protein [Cellulomonas endophytica]|uniref:diguanylate cyclase domain-containing protein n=1 Tax=Cellulomonas endophytica TaxID=2494735 RepID=UPI0013E9640D|nr:diguanylate cyclase [Cellulomonas endophytica]